MREGTTDLQRIACIILPVVFHLRSSLPVSHVSNWLLALSGVRRFGVHATCPNHFQRHETKLKSYMIRLINRNSNKNLR